MVEICRRHYIRYKTMITTQQDIVTVKMIYHTLVYIAGFLFLIIETF